MGIETYGEQLTGQEIEFVERFQAAGHRLRWIPRDRKTLKPTNDFVWLNNACVEVELKSTKPRYSSIQGAIHRAIVKARRRTVVKENFMVDLGNQMLTRKLRHQLRLYNRRNAPNPVARLWVMAHGAIESIDLV